MLYTKIQFLFKCDMYFLVFKYIFALHIFIYFQKYARMAKKHWYKIYLWPLFVYLAVMYFIEPLCLQFFFVHIFEKNAGSVPKKTVDKSDDRHCLCSLLSELSGVYQRFTLPRWPVDTAIPLL